MTITRKKLIEVALPLEAINEEGSRRKRKAPAGYPTTLHKWWAQRPIAAARAVVFAQMVDDPSSLPDLFPSEKKQQRERKRLFDIIEELVRWENTNNERILKLAREEIWQSWRRACADNADHPRAGDLFNRHKLPPFHDPFAGSGAIPMEAQRLGLETHASDLNPVAVLINKAVIEIPSMFSGRPPLNPESRSQKTLDVHAWKSAQGVAVDVRYYAKWMRDEAEKRIGDLYPKIEVTSELARGRPDLKPLVGRKFTVIAWLWARTVKSPDPAFARVQVPLASTFMLSTNVDKEAYVEPVKENGDYTFRVKVGKPNNAERVKNGTKLARGANFKCLMSGSPIDGDYIKAEGMAGRMGARLMAIVADGDRGRVYLSPTLEQEATALIAKPAWKPDGYVPARLTGGTCVPYGLSTWASLFTARQLVALTTFAELVSEATIRVKGDAIAAGLKDDGTALSNGGTGATAYSEAIGVYLAMAISRLADYGSSIATWRPKDNAMRSTLPKQAIQMTWDFAEGSAFGSSSAGFEECVDVVAKVIERALPDGSGNAVQSSVQDVQLAGGHAPVISTDPPYYDNVGYADLSDFFYVWLRHSLSAAFPNLFTTIAVPKAQELVAAAYRHGGRDTAEAFFLDGMTQAMQRLAEQAHPAYPVTIYYAYKQSENEGDAGTTSTGWETFLEAVIRAGFTICGTWPMRTEGDNRQLSIANNALASSIVLVCRRRGADSPTATRGEFVRAARAELPAAFRRLQAGNIAPVDLAQAAIGPGMAIFTRYAQVLGADDTPLTVRDALTEINKTLDEALAEQEGDFDADTRFALAWFEQLGFSEGDFGTADVLARAKNTSVKGLADAGILKSSRGKVRLLAPKELPAKWNPSTDTRRNDWEVVHHLIRVLESGGESAAADIVRAVGAKADIARELGYRLYSLCVANKRASEALAYNGLVQAWPEIVRLAQGGRDRGEVQPDLEGLT